MKKKISDNVQLWGKWKIIWANTKNLPKCLDLIRDGTIDGIGLSPYSGSDINNLFPFFECRELKILVLPYADDIDLNNLGRMDFLLSLVVGGASCPIDISGLNSLEDLSIDWNKKLRLPSNSHALCSLRLDKYSPINLDLSELSRFSRLSKIEFVKGNLETLHGCSEFQSLEEIQLHYLSKLKAIKCLSKTPVKKVLIGNCKKILDLASLATCQNLEVIHYHDSASLESIKFIKKCKALKEFRFVNVDVLDGDMTPLLGIKEFAFTKKKHFSHSDDMIRKLQLV